ncbi:MAG: MutS-related protein [Steroidobacteraceae bacterium]
MPFRSILFDRAEDEGASHAEAPDCFRDLRLDQVVASITAGREDYALTPIFHRPLKRIESIRCRHEIFGDLEDRALAVDVASFGTEMQAVRERIARSEKAYYVLQQQRWFLDALMLYGEAVGRLARSLNAAGLGSSVLGAFRDYLAEYLRSDELVRMLAQAKAVDRELAAIRYELRIEGRQIEVRACSASATGAAGLPDSEQACTGAAGRADEASDYAAEVARTFRKFERDGAREYRFRFHDYPQINHVEAAILERVARLFPREFAALAAFREAHRNALDPLIVRFDREVQFYLACLGHVERLRRTGLEFCYPEVTDRSKAVCAEAAFDLALAAALAADGKPVVTNDFALDGAERILVVTGANQGGKTTFARAFGQLHYLAALGCPVPGRRALLFAFDEIYTHFEREEAVGTLSGKLEEELVRMHRILEAATPRSILIMNESFGATTLADALYLGRRVLQRIVERDMLGVCVTFLDELAALGRATVSLVSQVAPDDPAVRTFKIIRQPANGLAHALAIARKYRLSYEDVRERLAAGVHPP